MMVTNARAVHKLYTSNKATDNLQKMPPHLIDYIGYAAGCLTTIAFIPQLTKIIRTRSARDVSLGMFLLFMVGVALWLAYGLLKNDWAIVVPNIITLTLSIAILACKLWFD